jgi:phage terminase large subunit-like protein
MAALTETELELLKYEWEFWARPNQLPPDRLWRLWLLLAGRGFGKTRAGAEWILRRVRRGARHLTLVGATPADARDVMVEGESGLLNVAPPWERPEFFPSKRLLVFPNGARAHIRSGHEPEGLRGIQHDTAWCDELAAWEYPRETWDMLMFGLRLGDDPRVVVTTTPKPLGLIKELHKRARGPDGALTVGSSYENATNLAEAFFDEIVGRYEGTTLGQQELHAKILDEAPGALWTRNLIERHRRSLPTIPFSRVVVAVDPAAKSKKENNETGIIVAGLLSHSGTEHAYILRDVSGRFPPATWAHRAVDQLAEWGGDRIVYEENMGGDMAAHTLLTADPNAPIKGVTASRSKQARAEPVSALYEQGRVHHVGTYDALEDQMCTYQPETDDESPDRLDAMVWALTELFHLGRRTAPVFSPAVLVAPSIVTNA